MLEIQVAQDHNICVCAVFYIVFVFNYVDLIIRENHLSVYGRKGNKYTEKYHLNVEQNEMT